MYVLSVPFDDCFLSEINNKVPTGQQINYLEAIISPDHAIEWWRMVSTKSSVSDVLIDPI